MPHRVFTVEKVNSLIPDMERVLADLEARRAEMERLETKLVVLDAIWGIRVYMVDNPDYREAQEHRNALAAAKYALEYTTYKEISHRGIRFPPGGLENGLLDF
ncbi:MAG TPA: hypothetical protein VFI96_05055, partial [Longimicrobiaceae bacterium]|nr:hypothetical protein [Longimicrobiaceae bacterium]